MFWKVGKRFYLKELGVDVWEFVEGGYQYLASIPTDEVGKNQYEKNEKVVNVILGGVDESEFVKFMQLSTVKAIWEKLV